MPIGLANRASLLCRSSIRMLPINSKYQCSSVLPPSRHYVDPTTNIGYRSTMLNTISQTPKIFNETTLRFDKQQQQSTRLMATASNYHYHEKPQGHAHDKLWKAERYLSLGLLGVLPAAAVIHHPVMDYVVALSLMVHVHWGVEAIVIDYVRPSIFGPTIPKIAIGLTYILSMLALGGLFMFNYTDVGITQATRMLAKI